MLDHMLFDLKKWFNVDTTKADVSNNTFTAVPTHVLIHKGAGVENLTPVVNASAFSITTVGDIVAPCLGANSDSYIIGRRGNELLNIYDDASDFTWSVLIATVPKSTCEPKWGVKPSKPRLTGLLTALRRVVISWL